MCEKCDRLDFRIEHYRKLVGPALDRLTRERVANLLNEMLAERAALHAKSRRKVRSLEAVRDEYTWELECSICKLTGFAKTSEYSYLHMRSLLFRVDEVSPGFRVSRIGNFAHDTEIVCVKCGVAV